MNAPITNGDITLKMYLIILSVLLKPPISLNISIAPRTNKSPYITIVKYLLLGWNLFLYTMWLSPVHILSFAVFLKEIPHYAAWWFIFT